MSGAAVCFFDSLRPISSWIASNCLFKSFPRLVFSRNLSSVRDLELIGVLSSCAKERNIRLGYSLHASIIKNPPPDPIFSTDVVIYNCLLHFYCKCGELNDASRVFDEMPVRDTVSWNSLISGLLVHGEFRKGISVFKLLVASLSCQFDNATLTTMLSAFAEAESLHMLKMIHALVIFSGFDKEISVGNALTNSYFRCCAFDSGMLVFNEMSNRNVVTWTAAISGLAKNGFYVESLKLFAEMCRLRVVTPNLLTYLCALSACSGLQAIRDGAQIHGAIQKLGFHSDICIETALMDMYSKSGLVDEVWRLFESAEELDEVSVTVVLSCFLQSGFEEEALRMFVKIVKQGMNVDSNMVSTILSVFGDLGASQRLGAQTHCLSVKRGFDFNIFVSNGLINMYSKCGDLGEAHKIFNSMQRKNEVSWNSMIAAYASHGHGIRALELYDEMISERVEPTDVTFLSLLHACSHSGLLQKGLNFLESMEKTHGIRPRIQHYACIVDMLGRAGHLKEAKLFIEGLPVDPNAVVIWQSLLGACGIHGDLDTGRYAAERVASAEPESSVPYLSVANMCCGSGRWGERAEAMKRMKENGVPKEKGVSWIEADGKIRTFVVADERHPDVYAVLFHLFIQMGDDDQHVDFFTQYS
ncbi:hypothetical protein M569_13103 [Genlisea aurea]|uniref:Pentatricopeptide repeat-containing protein n=1 Tax=Genlisea aurea TaxID=192259 RepID=S8DPH4_9LAMI|nr:hypothetical protein M569_13103 [Genlisea aurea]